jgi:DNA polymerase V
MFQRHHALLRRAVPAIFPATEYIERRRNLDEHQIQYRQSTFFVRVAGNSMCGMNIFDGDLLVVDRSAPIFSGCLVIAIVENEFTVKQLLITPEGQVLRAAHPSYPDIVIKSGQNLSIWGVVQWNVHKQ